MNNLILEKLGLTKSEVDVYLFLLKSGSNSAAKISKETRLNRSHIYDTLAKLINRGFVSVYESNKTKYFNAFSPEKLQDYIKELEGEINKIIPELKNIKEISRENTKVQLFQGKDGIKTILKDIILEKKDYLVLGEEGQFENIFPIYIEQFLRDIKHYKIKEKILTRQGTKILKTENTEIRYLEREYLSPSTTVIYGNKIATIIWSSPYNATLIEDKEVAQSYKGYFEQLWKLGKR